MPNDDIRYLSLNCSRCLRSLDAYKLPSTIMTYLQGRIKIMHGMVNDISEKNISITYSRNYLYTLH